MKKFVVLVWAILCMLCSAVAEDSSLQESLNVSNCEELAALLNAESSLDERMEQFASQYSGQTIDINGFIYDEGFGSWRDIEIYAGDYETAFSASPRFLLKGVYPENLGFESDFPDFIKYGNDVRVVGKIKEYDDFDDGIVLEPILLELRNPFLEACK